MATAAAATHMMATTGISIITLITIITNMRVEVFEDPLTPTLSPRGDGVDCETLATGEEGVDCEARTTGEEGTGREVLAPRGEGLDGETFFRTEDAELEIVTSKDEEVGFQLPFVARTVGEGTGQGFLASQTSKDDSGNAPSPPRGEGGLSQSQALLKLQSWLSPSFPIGAYSYSHGLEWAVEAGKVRDRSSLIDWLDGDLRFGTARNEGIFFCEAWRLAQLPEIEPLIELAELAAAYRGTSEFALEATQQGAACLATIRRAWPSETLNRLAAALAAKGIPATLSHCLGSACGAHAIALELSLPLYLQSIVANLVTAAVRLIPLGQTDGQLTLAALEGTVAWASVNLGRARLDDLGSAAFMVDLASMAHETQYTRLFRS